MIPHQTEEDLELYALGRLSPARVEAVEEHLLVCESCRNMLDDLESFAIAMHDAIATEPEPAPRTEWLARLGFHWFREPDTLAWAGGFAALLLAAVLYLHFGTGSMLPLASLQLTAIRGEMPSVSQAKETDVTLVDAPANPALHAEVVDFKGKQVWSGSLGGGRIVIAQPLAEGSYFVRLSDSGGKLLREYGFQVGH